MKSLRWLARCGGALLGCVSTLTSAQADWRPFAKPTPAAPAGISLGAPQAVSKQTNVVPVAWENPTTSTSWNPGSWASTPSTPPIPTGGYAPAGGGYAGSPYYPPGLSAGQLTNGGFGDPPPPSPVWGSGIPPTAPPPTDPYTTIPPPPHSSAPGEAPPWWGKFKEVFVPQPCGGPGREAKWFQSDHAFDGLISPVTSPFYFEDPRSLTEIRPMFMYQRVPDNAPGYNGGNIYYYGIQGRLALNDRFSIVLNKLGGLVNDPDNTAVFTNSSGFAELWLGPKFTIIRNENTGTVGAAGLTFQIPVGDAKIFQDTGELTLDPYFSIGQTANAGSFGKLNFMANAGYAFSVNDKRSQYFHSSFHVDYNVAGLNKFYPLVELNWVHYTKSGTSRSQTFEGGDLINFGANSIAGRDYLNLGLGFRYKFSEAAQFGMALEFPLVGTRDLNQLRLGLDFILRY